MEYSNLALLRLGNHWGNDVLTQIPTQNGKGAGGSGGGNRAEKHPTLEQKCPESAKKLPPAPLAAAHNPKVTGSNPAPATKLKATF